MDPYASSCFGASTRALTSLSHVIIPSRSRTRLRSCLPAGRFRLELGRCRKNEPRHNTRRKLLNPAFRTFLPIKIPSHTFHNDFKTRCTSCPPRRQAIGYPYCPKAYLCISSKCCTSWCDSCSQGSRYLAIPADPWSQDD